MVAPVQNLRVHFYGVQGSSSTFPSRVERKAIREMMDYQLLDAVFADLEARADKQGNLSLNLKEMLGGERSKKLLSAYRASFDVPETGVYGGWTTCVRVEAGDGLDFVFDCGSGFRNCAGDLQSSWGDRPSRQLFLFGSHSHLDHTEGFDQAEVCFDPRNEIIVHANRQFLRALDQNLGIFTKKVDENLIGVQTPLHYGKMPTTFTACEIRNLIADPPPAEDPLADRYHDVCEPLVIGETRITMTNVFHPSPCLAYRLEHGGKAFVFCTDHELMHGVDEDDARYVESRAAEDRLSTLAMDADLMYRDGQFFRVEYDGLQGIGSGSGMPRIGWGHSCIEDVMEMAERCRVKTTLIGHHDPNRDWSERTWVDAALSRRSEQTGLRFELAQAETIFDL